MCQLNCYSSVEIKRLTITSDLVEVLDPSTSLKPLVTPGIIHISLRSGTINSQPLMIILTPQDKWLNVFDNENIHSAVVPS